MKRFFLFLAAMIAFASHAQKPKTDISIEHKQKVLDSLAFSKEVVFLEEGYVYHQGDTVFFNFLPSITFARYSTYLDFDTIYIVTVKNEKYGYSRHIEYYGVDVKIIPIIDTVTGLKKMQGWRYLNQDEYFFPVLERVLKNGKCVFPSQMCVPSQLGISKDEFEKFIDDPLYFPDSLSGKMQRTLNWYNPILFKKMGL